MVQLFFHRFFLIFSLVHRTVLEINTRGTCLVNVTDVLVCGWVDLCATARPIPSDSDVGCFKL
eukprot:m.177406 g.177406  ORF g.177406 m.177406 type:complete len:63 (-) comp14909_c0_seq3:754-942(-)